MTLKKIWQGMMLLLLVFLLIGCSSTTKKRYATISGYIRSHTGWYLEGVKVDVGGKAQAISDYYGNFTTGQFPLGTYIMSFTKEGYWTLSFPVTFDQTGELGFIDDIYLSKVISGEGTVEDPALFKDYPSNTRVTIKAEKQVNKLIAIPYNSSYYNTINNTNLCITSDSGVGPTAVSTEKPLKYSRTPNVLEQRLRERNQKIIPNLLAKGIKPGVATRSIISKSAEPTLSFYKYNFDDHYTFSTVQANLKYNGTKCLIYLDKTQNIGDTYIQQLGQAFDTFYYDRIIQYFGDLTVDIDDFPKVYILLTNLLHDNTGAILGYFDPANEFEKEIYQFSNAKEMLYLTTYTYNESPTSWLDMIKSVSAHEFQHLINFSCRQSKGDSPLWMNEGLSMLAEDIAIAGPGGHNPELDEIIQLYLKYHEFDCLEDWTNGDSLDYATAYMFMRYLADRCGENLIKTLNTTNATPGRATIADIAGGTDFEEIFKDWLTAVILSATGYSNINPDFNNKYLYKTIDLSTFEFPKESPGYIDMSSGSGAFVSMPDLDGADRIDVTISGDEDIDLRLIMIPAAGVSYSSFKAPQIMKLR